MCSNKITLTVIYQTDKKQLLNLYSIKPEILEDSWPPVVSRTFIKALVKYKKDHTEVYDYSVRGDADDIIAKKEKSSIKKIW